MLGLTKLCAKLIPKNFNEEQKQNWRRFCEDWLENFDDVFTRAITDDELRFFEYNPAMKRQSIELKEKGEAPTTKARISKSRVKAMVIVLIYCYDIILQEWIPAGQTVNAAYYIEVLKKITRKNFEEMARVFGGK